MFVVAGPPGSGKTTAFPVTSFGVDAFNIDDRCAQVLGSYRAIPRNIRRAVATECESFVNEHIANGRSFAVETTLRTTAAVEQARTAAQAGFSGVRSIVNWSWLRFSARARGRNGRSSSLVLRTRERTGRDLTMFRPCVVQTSERKQQLSARFPAPAYVSCH